MEGDLGFCAGVNDLDYESYRGTNLKGGWLCITITTDFSRVSTAEYPLTASESES